MTRVTCSNYDCLHCDPRSYYCQKDIVSVEEFTEERGIKHEEASGTAASGDDAAKEGGS